jgi:LPXTG-motif cell wall-anchored protein
MMRKLRMIGAVGALILAASTVALTAGPAQAVEPKPEHKTVTTKVTDRPDGGNHGVWATDSITRKVVLTGGPGYVLPDAAAKVAQARSAQPDVTICTLVEKFGLSWNYTAKVTDKGTFVTVDGKSPNAGKDLKAGTKGTVEGSFTATFTAPAHWCTFDPKALQGKTVKGDQAPKTSEWVKSLFTAGFDGNSINDDWSWTYTTCAEKWWDAADPASNDGETDAAGDITGMVCVEPTPSNPAPPAVEPAPGAGGGLPVTGTSVPLFAGGGLALLVIGAGAVWLTRRRRFTA